MSARIARKLDPGHIEEVANGKPPDVSTSARTDQLIAE